MTATSRYTEEEEEGRLEETRLPKESPNNRNEEQLALVAPMASIQSESGVRSWLWRFCTVPLHLHFGPMMGPDVFVTFRGANGPPMASFLSSLVCGWKRLSEPCSRCRVEKVPSMTSSRSLLPVCSQASSCSCKVCRLKMPSWFPGSVTVCH